MKVIIKNSGSAHYWYADKIGYVFEVGIKDVNIKGLIYKIVEYDKYIHENDVVKFSIIEFVRINWPYFIGHKKQITRKF
jgi:hypothetical protein